MKQKINLARILRYVLLLGLIVCACFAAVRAQTVIPTVCIIPNSRTGTTTLTANAAAGALRVVLDTQGGTLPIDIRIIINPGGSTEETVVRAYTSATGGPNYDFFGTGPALTYAHNAGETALWFTDATVVWGYNNKSSATVIIPRSITSPNYFSPGRVFYSPEQPNTFLPGIHTAFSIDFPTRDAAIDWVLNNGLATASKTTPACATISYQGRLTDAGSAANGVYDLQFTAFDALTGGTAQTDTLLVEDATVTSGIFTVQLNFGPSFLGNNNARFLQIGVRAGTSTGAFTTLTPRQPISTVPYAVNAQTAFDVRLRLTTGAPVSTECNEASEHGGMKIDAGANRLYVCTATGWKSTVLQ